MLCVPSPTYRTTVIHPPWGAGAGGEGVERVCRNKCVSLINATSLSSVSCYTRKVLRIFKTTACPIRMSFPLMANIEVAQNYATVPTRKARMPRLPWVIKLSTVCRKVRHCASIRITCPNGQDSETHRQAKRYLPCLVKASVRFRQREFESSLRRRGAETGTTYMYFLLT